MQTISDWSNCFSSQLDELLHFLLMEHMLILQVCDVSFGYYNNFLYFNIVKMNVMCVLVLVVVVGWKSSGCLIS
jgi:hypothetical protein